MPKDNRLIAGSVRIGKDVFTAGMEDELEAAAGEGVLQRLTKRGVISGFVKEKPEPKEADKPKK